MTETREKYGGPEPPYLYRGVDTRLQIMVTCRWGKCYYIFLPLCVITTLLKAVVLTCVCVVFVTPAVLSAVICFYGRVRMANPGSSRVSRDPFELLGALSK